MQAWRDIPAKIYSFQQKYKLSLDSGELKHIRPYIENTSGTVSEIYSGVAYSDYDTNVITINEAGYIFPIAEGRTDVLLSYRGMQLTVAVEVIS